MSRNPLGGSLGFHRRWSFVFFFKKHIVAIPLAGLLVSTDVDSEVAALNKCRNPLGGSLGFHGLDISSTNTGVCFVAIPLAGLLVSTY